MKKQTKRIDDLEQGRSLDIDSISELPSLQVLAPVLVEIKTDLMMKFATKALTKDIETKVEQL